MRRCLTVLLTLLVLQYSTAHAGDYGPQRDLRDVTSAVKHLVAHRLRVAKDDPVLAVVSDVVVVKNQALASWSAGTQRGVMGLMRYEDRWWDAFDETQQPKCPSAGSAFPAKPFALTGLDRPLDPVSVGFDPAFVAAAQTHNSAFAALQRSSAITCSDDVYEIFSPVISANGGRLTHLRSETSGYDVDLTYARNNALPGARLSSMRVRPPTPAEVLSYPSPPRGAGGTTGVLFLYFDLDSKAPVSFEKGSKFDVWVPWVMDDSLRYELELYEGPTVVGPIKASVFDNVLHFELPAFPLLPGETLGEIDGYW